MKSDERKRKEIASHAGKSEGLTAGWLE